MKRWGVVLVVVASALLGCGGAAAKGDASARLACDHFRNVAGDFTDGVLTNNELRSKMVEVYEDARLSGVSGISSAAQVMASELTAGRMGADFDSAVRSFGDACRSIDR